MNDSSKALPSPTTSCATSADSPAIARLLVEAFEEYRSLYTLEGFAATTPAADVIAARMAEGPVWIVIEENAIVGTLGAIAKGDDLYLRSMAVSPRARGRKIGWHLLETASLFAGDRDLVLSTTPFLDRAIALYERWGFRHTDEPPHDLFGTPLFTMRKKCSVLSARCSVLGFTKH